MYLPGWWQQKFSVVTGFVVNMVLAGLRSKIISTTTPLQLIYGTNGSGHLRPLIAQKNGGQWDPWCPFELLETVDIMLQNCLHQNCVIHGDLKSMNILVKCDEHEMHVYAKVADFGLSKRNESGCTYTKLMMDWGTTWWMTPKLFGESEDHVGPSGQVNWVYHWSIPSKLTSTTGEWHVMRFWQDVSLSIIPNWRSFRREYRMVWGQIYLNNVLNKCPPWFWHVIIPTLHGLHFLTFMALWHRCAFHVHHTWWECSFISDLDAGQKSIRA